MKGRAEKALKTTFTLYSVTNSVRPLLGIQKMFTGRHFEMQEWTVLEPWMTSRSGVPPVTGVTSLNYQTHWGTWVAQ